MLTRKLVLFALLFCVVSAWAEVAPIERTSTVAASPLQAYQALCVDWQMQQWTFASGVFSEPQVGGAWQVLYDPRHKEQGQFEQTDPGLLLVYTFFFDSAATRVRASFDKVGDSTRVTIVHADFGVGDAGETHHEAALQYWAEKLPLLTNYLNQIPGSYVARPHGAAPFPVVLLLHDQFGMNRTTRGLADSLATRGYLTLAVDMFKGSITGDLVEAKRFLDLVKDDQSLEACTKGIQYLSKREDADPKKVAVWGLGYGGSLAVRVATVQPKLRCCENWYGEKLPDVSLISRIACPMQAIFSAHDSLSAVPQLEAYNHEFVQAGVRAETIWMLGGQGFADPAYGEGFNPESLRNAWRVTLAFIDRNMRP